MDKNPEALDEIKKALDSEGHIKAKQLGRETLEVYYLRGMEGDVEEGEIREAISRVIGQWTEGCKMSPIRILRDDTAAVTVTIPTNMADGLRQRDEMRVGLVRCKFEKRVVVPRCRKCWSLAHKTGNCDGPDRTRNCYKCGGEDHMAQECQRDEFCPVC
nr:uncharacterized protein LOC111516352 [Leptinotarsa decemlineata]